MNDQQAPSIPSQLSGVVPNAASKTAQEKSAIKTRTENHSARIVRMAFDQEDIRLARIHVTRLNGWIGGGSDLAAVLPGERAMALIPSHQLNASVVPIQQGGGGQGEGEIESHRENDHLERLSRLELNQRCDPDDLRIADRHA